MILKDLEVKMSNNNIESILALFSKEQFNEALDAIQGLIINDPNDALLFNIRGACYAGLDQLNLAKENYEKAIALNPGYAKAHYNLAGALHELDEFDASIQSYQNALVIEPDYAEAHNNLGSVFKETGQLDAAIKSYEKAINIKPDYLEAYYSLGTSFQELGKLKDTVQCYEKVLELRPNLTGTLNNLGNILRELGRFDEAILNYEKAISIDPNFVEVYFNLGTTFQELNQLKNAIKHYKKAIEINSNYHEALNNLGVAYKDLKEFDSAVEAYQMALNIKPDYAEALNNIGIVYKELGQLDDAIKSHKGALNILPEYAEAHNNLGIILIEGKQLNEAIERFKKAIAADANFIEAYNNIGSYYIELNNFDLSLENFQKALLINPNYVEAHNNLGRLFMHLGQLDKAVESFQKSIKIKPNYEYAHNNLGLAYNDLGNWEEAAKCYKRAMTINPSYFEPCANYANLLTDLNDFDEALRIYERANELKPEADYMQGNILHTKMRICVWDNYSNQLIDLQSKINDGKKVIGPFQLIALIDDPEIQSKVSIIYAQDKYPQNNFLPKMDHYPKHKKIRIGYFSADFREHPVAFLTAELYEIHDRSQFEVHAFSYGPNSEDKFNLRIKAGVDQFHDVSKMSHKEIATLSRSLEIDIAVDLSGTTQNCRTEVFAMSAAPIQTSYIGWLGTMGADYYDYLIAAKGMIPKKNQKYFSEKIAYLPSYQVNDSKEILPEASLTLEDLGLPKDSFVFCCFNNTYKITPIVFDSWARILKRVEKSVMMIYVANKSAQNNLTKEITNRGVNPERLYFGENLQRDKYLDRYRLADLFLDTFPYNAGTTASDALKMGLPILTLKGNSFNSREAANIISAVNLSEMIAASQEEYESLAIELAKNPMKYRTIKDKLVDNLPNAPLYNTRLFAKNIESAYKTMFERYHQGLDPDHIYVEDLNG